MGNVEVMSLSDGDIEFATPLTDVFPKVPEVEWLSYRQRYPGVFAGPNAWRIHIGCYLVRSKGRTILVDTGLGPEPNARFIGTTGILLADLKAKGIEASEIDTVFLTHSHGDHIGWNLMNDGSRVFSNARYVLSRIEWHWLPGRIASGMAGTAAAQNQVLPLGGMEALELLDGETALTDEVTAIETPGHTPGHMSLILFSSGEKACITGDAIVHPAQMTEPDWWVRMDADGPKASLTRHSLLQRLETEGMTMISCHFPRPGYGQIVRIDGRRYWQVS